MVKQAHNYILYQALLFFNIKPKPPQGGQQEIDHPAPMMAGRLNKP